MFASRQVYEMPKEAAVSQSLEARRDEELAKANFVDFIGFFVHLVAVRPFVMIERVTRQLMCVVCLRCDCNAGVLPPVMRPFTIVALLLIRLQTPANKTKRSQVTRRTEENHRLRSTNQKARDHRPLQSIQAQLPNPDQ
jgi:hypothetical protein